MSTSFSRYQWWEYDRRASCPVEVTAEEAQELCQRALEISDRVEAETWLSSVLGTWWNQSEGLREWDVPDEAQSDIYFLVTGPAIREVAAVGGAGAGAILQGVSRFAAGRVARLAGDLADTLNLPHFDSPSWTRYLGEWRPVREWSQRRPSGNEVIAIELRHILDEPRWLATYTAGWGSTRIELYRSFDEVEDFAKAVARKNAKVLPFQELPAGDGCQRAYKAVCEGRGYWKNAERFLELRAWALAMTRPRMTDSDRRRHLERLEHLIMDQSDWDQPSF